VGASADRRAAWPPGGDSAGVVAPVHWAGWLRAAFTTLLCELDPDPPVPEPQGSALGDAVAAIVAAMGAAGGRWSLLIGVSPWELAAAVTGGRLLSPGSRVEVGNTSCPW
jgi:hypothetical protein